MKRINGISLLLISIGITSFASLLKLSGFVIVAEILLWTGMTTCVAAIGMIVYNIVKSK